MDPTLNPIDALPDPADQARHRHLVRTLVAYTVAFAGSLAVALAILAIGRT